LSQKYNSKALKSHWDKVLTKLEFEIEEIKGIGPSEVQELELEESKLIEMLRKMLEIRIFEEKVEELYVYEAALKGAAHLYLGEEAIAVGVCSAIKKEGYVFSTHRGHGHALAMGISPKEVMAELFGKVTGVCRGLGGSMHACIDPEKGAMWASAIVGSSVPIAVGAGLSLKYSGKPGVTVAFFSDGATNTGAWHEALNLASFWKLPVVFACENNQYAISMPASKAVTCGRVAYRAVAYGIPGMIVDGNDVLSVYKATMKAKERAKRGEGPTLIEFLTYRMKGHGVYDKAEYRPRDEEEKWKKLDPISRFSKLLLELGVISSEDLKRLENEVKEEIEEAVEFSKKSDFPPFSMLEEVTFR